MKSLTSYRYKMNIQKRVVDRTTDNHFSQKSSVLLEQKPHQSWRRFMNERAIDRAYIPTSHGILSFSNDTVLLFISIDHKSMQRIA